MLSSHKVSFKQPKKLYGLDIVFRELRIKEITGLIGWNKIDKSIDELKQIYKIRCPLDKRFVISYD